MADDNIRPTTDPRSDRLGMSPEMRSGQERMVPPPRDDRERKLEQGAVGGGSGAEVILGIGAIVLAILSIMGVVPTTLATIATIAIGVAMMGEWTAMATRYARLAPELRPEHLARVDFGVSAEFVGGLVGVVLGILGLLGVAPYAMIEASLIAFGGAMIIGAGSAMQFRRVLAADLELHPDVRSIPMQAFESVGLGFGARILFGVGLIALGILALISFANSNGADQLAVVGIRLTQSGLIVAGVASLLAGAAIGGRYARSRSRDIEHHHRRVA